MSSYLIYEYIYIPSLYLFLFIYFIRFIMIIGMEDWFLVWIGLEINIMSFLVLIYHRFRLGRIESCLKYFFIQSLGSAILIGIFYLDNKIILRIVPLILRYRIGAGPFFYWFPRICSNLEWYSCYGLILFQKILPLLLIFLFIHWVMWFVIIIRLIIGIYGSMNQSDLKQLIAYSSVHHLGWIIILILGKEFVWIIYLLIYSIILYTVFIVLARDNIINFSILFCSKYKVIFMLSILRIGGIPPILGFFLKWLALELIIRIRKIYMLFLVIVSVIILYVYIRIIYDVIIGRRIKGWLDFEIISYFIRVDVLSIRGILFGIIIGIYFVL